jgi:hypothetical protein
MHKPYLWSLLLNKDLSAGKRNDFTNESNPTNRLKIQITHVHEGQNEKQMTKDCQDLNSLVMLKETENAEYKFVYTKRCLSTGTFDTCTAGPELDTAYRIGLRWDMNPCH